MFWLTSTTVRETLGADYQAWRFFGPVHLFWLALCAGLTCLVWTRYPKLDKQTKKNLLLALTVLMVADELFKDIPSLVTGQFEWGCLPFHLCSVNLFVAVLHTLRESRATKAILTCVCVPAALCALVMPTWTCLPMWNFMHLHSETIHIMLFLYPMMILADGYRPGRDMIPVLMGYLVGLACVDKGINALLGTNFLFLTHNENNPALILLENLTGRFYNAAIVLLLILLCSGVLAFWNLFRVKDRSTVQS